MSKMKSSNDTRKEEIRGLFVLGLLAVLSSIRIQNSEMIVEIGQASFNIIFWIDITIVLWSLYAFFMVLGLSEDLVGKPISSSFREMSKVFLGLNYTLLIFFSLLVFILGFLPRLPYALSLILALICYVIITKLRKRKEPLEIKLNIWKTIKSNTPQMLKLTFTLCVILTIFTLDEYVIPFFIIGCVSFVLFIVIKEKVKLR